jgi:hypothetical protein
MLESDFYRMTKEEYDATNAIANWRCKTPETTSSQ